MMDTQESRKLIKGLICEQVSGGSYIYIYIYIYLQKQTELYPCLHHSCLDEQEMTTITNYNKVNKR